jgi:hypothetical protein
VVPGMTERERRAADLQRLAWLADAIVGPTGLPCGNKLGVLPGNRESSTLGMRQRRVRLPVGLGRLVRRLWPSPGGQPMALQQAQLVSTNQLFR